MLLQKSSNLRTALLSVLKRYIKRVFIVFLFMKSLKKVSNGVYVLRLCFLHLKNLVFFFLTLS